MRWFDDLVDQYIAERWTNYGQRLSEPEARYQLLSAACLYSYALGTTTLLAIHFFDAEGYPPNPLALPANGCDLKITSATGRTIGMLSVAPPPLTNDEGISRTGAKDETANHLA